MILDVTSSNLPQIKNPVLRDYAAIYVSIYQDFIENNGRIGLEVDKNNLTPVVTERIESLRKRGANIRNSNKSIYINRISPSCLACKTGKGSSSFYISLKCHRDCYFCFNPNQEDFEYYREHTRDTIKELDDVRANRQKLQHIALTGGEPLLFKAKTYSFFAHAHQLFPSAYTRLYTSGDHIDMQTLEALQKSGLDEIRFSIRMYDLEKGHCHTFDKIALACKYIQNVLVEMPVLPGTLDAMKNVLIELDCLGIFGINLLEFCYPFNNTEVFQQNGYRIKARPFRVLYDYWYAGGLPISGSEMVCLDLVDFAIDKGLKLGIHYCSLENKHTGQIYKQNRGHSLPKWMYFSNTDYFIKTAKVFGEDVPRVKQLFDKSGYRDYLVNNQYDYIEFHVSKISGLIKFDIEVGISSNVIEIRNNEVVYRELKMDITTPRAFRLSDDI